MGLLHGLHNLCTFLLSPSDPPSMALRSGVGVYKVLSVLGSILMPSSILVTEYAPAKFY